MTKNTEEWGKVVLIFLKRNEVLGIIPKEYKYYLVIQMQWEYNLEILPQFLLLDQIINVNFMTMKNILSVRGEDGRDLVK